MNKILLALPLFLLLMTSVLAIEFVSIRGKDGRVNFIDSDRYFTFSRIHFSAYSREASSLKNEEQGQGGLLIHATDLDGDSIKLSLNFKQTRVLRNDLGRLIVQGDFKGNYWKKGTSPKRIDGTITYNYDKFASRTNVIGTGDVSFSVTGINTEKVSK